MYPIRRLRRLRENKVLRGLLEETRISKEDLIYPMFVKEGLGGGREQISLLPGLYRYGVESLKQEVEELVKGGLKALILFGIPQEKDLKGEVACREDGIIQDALRELRKEFGKELLLITDLCFCEYTTHGHCGVLEVGEVEERGKGSKGSKGSKRGKGSKGSKGAKVDNDKTLLLLGKQALSHAQAGADIIAPSGMMDGMVAEIRGVLDGEGHTGVGIMSYSVKYASSYYGPFRDAAGSSPSYGDRRGYQMNPSNVKEGYMEAEQDIIEGADILMVKPALSYLDIIYRLKEEYVGIPIAAYNVSGEYAMIKAGGALGYIDEREVALESLLSIKRAGADIILTYFAKDFIRWKI